MATAYDVIIVGAGSIGCPTAFFLAQEELKVLVIEKFRSPGQGSNKAAIGGIRATHSDTSKIRICLRSLEIFSTWEERYGDNLEWAKGGYCFVAYRPQEEKALKGLLVIQKRYGLNINWLDRDELLEVIPALNPDGLIGGTYSPDDGSASPLRSASAFTRRAMERGAEFHFDEILTEIVTARGRVIGVRTNRDLYSSECVINAAGAWAKGVAQMADLDVPVRPDCHEGGITEPVAPFLGPMVVDVRPAPGSKNYYFYQHKPGPIVFCITPDPPIWGINRLETSAFLPMIAPRMVNLMPKLANIKVRRTWRGTYPMTPDGFPIVGRVKGLEGYINAVGMCGQGFMLGPGLATYLVHVVKNELTPEDEEVLAGLSLYRDFGGQEKLK
jgi:sarcosine oxidase subunit beta